MTGSAVIVALVGWVAVAAAPAPAPTPTPTPEPGVQVDPNSPSGKEYAIPLEDARRQASPSGGAQTTTRARVGGSAVAPLFGVGVNAAAAASSTRRRASAGSDANRSPTRAQSGKDPTMAAPPSASVLQAASRPGAPSGGEGATALLVGGAVVLLALGVVTGVLLRRRSRG